MRSFSKYIVDERAVVENFEYVNASAGGTIAVLKADGYGLGAETLFKILRPRAKGFGVACLDEALRLRELDREALILIVGVVSDFKKAIDENISVCVQSREDLFRLKRALRKTKKVAKVHLKINTGMNRLGVKKPEVYDLIIDLFREKKVVLEGVFTHFCTADCDEQFLKRQVEEFKSVIKLLPSGVSPIIHFGGGGISRGQIKRFGLENYVLRSGIKLINGLSCALKIESKVIKILELKEGERLGYSNGFIADRKMKIGVVPLGYADGMFRKLTGRVAVKVGVKNCKIIGNICMDMFFIDLSKAKAKLFDKVIVFDGPNAWAKALGTIDYEIFTSLSSKRMNKVVKKIAECDNICS